MERSKIIDRDLKLGNVASATGFSSKRTTRQPIEVFQIGDIITFDDVNETGGLKAYYTFVGASKKDLPKLIKDYQENGEDAEVQPAYYTYVTVTRGDKELTMQFFPGTFTKSRFQVDKSGNRTNLSSPVQAKGTAVELYLQEADEKAAMNQFVGKSIIIGKNSEKVRCLRFGIDIPKSERDFQNTWIYELNMYDPTAANKQDAGDNALSLAQERGVAL